MMYKAHTVLLGLILLASPSCSSPFIVARRNDIYTSTEEVNHAWPKRQDTTVQPTDVVPTTDGDTPTLNTTSTIASKEVVGTAGGTLSNLTLSGKQATQAEIAAPTTDFSLLVCGNDGDAGTVASDSRNADAWTGHNMDDWFSNALKPYLENGWKAPDGTQKKNIQSIILTLMGADGSDQCDEISDPNCSGQGLSWQKCKAHPEAHFLWFANTHWANFLNKMQETLQNSDLSLDTNKLTKGFYTPQKDPQQILVPLAVLAGIAGALSVAIPPAGVIAGGLSIAQGVVIQAGLDKADPLKQWADVTSSVASSFTLLTKALEKIFDSSLKTLPDANSDYLKTAIMEPAVFSGGRFTGVPKVGSINNVIYSSLASGAINTLWASDMVFLMKFDDSIWGKGRGIKKYNSKDDIGGACDALPKLTLCIDGVAYLLLRWKLSQTKAAVTPGSGANSNELDFSQAATWGAGSTGGPIAGTPNADRMPDYGLNVRDTMLSIENTWKVSGQKFPFTDQNSAIIDYLNSNPTNPQLKDFLFFSLPVCDLKELFGDDHYIDHETDSNGKNPIEMYGACLCVLVKGWPKDKYPLGPGLPESICRRAIKKK